MFRNQDWLLACQLTAPSPSFSRWSLQRSSVWSDESYKVGGKTRGKAKHRQSWQRKMKNQYELNLEVLLARLVNHSARQQPQLGDKQRVFLVVVYMENLHNAGRKQLFTLSRSKRIYQIPGRRGISSAEFRHLRFQDSTLCRIYPSDFVIAQRMLIPLPREHRHLFINILFVSWLEKVSSSKTLKFKRTDKYSVFGWSTWQF